MSDPRKRLEDMDRVGIDVGVVSLSTPNVFFSDERGQPEVARAMNDAYAELIARHPGRFKGFASISMDAPDAALKELHRARGAVLQGPEQSAGRRRSRLRSVVQDEHPRAPPVARREADRLAHRPAHLRAARGLRARGEGPRGLTRRHAAVSVLAETALRASSSSSIVCQRRAGSFSSARRITASSSGGSARLSARGFGGGVWM